MRDYLQRLTGFARSALEANFRDLLLPYRLFLYTTDACNCRCNMCNIWQKPTDGELTTPELSRVLINARHHTRWMDLSGGEIFLRPDITDLFTTIAEEMPDLLMFHFATNGILTDKILDCARIIKRSSIPHFIVTVSLDGPPELHEEIRGVPGIWAKCMSTFRGLRAMGVQVVFGMTLTEHNHDQYEATFEAVRREVPGISHQDFHVNIAQVSDLYYGNRSLIDPPYEAILHTVETVAKLRGSGVSPVHFLEQRFLKNAPTYLRTGKSPMICEALSSSCVVGTRGEVYPCIIYDAPIGNLKDHGYSIASLWQTERRKHLREEIREGKCPQCWTPCEAYQSILANVAPLGKNRGGLPKVPNPTAANAGAGAV